MYKNEQLQAIIAAYDKIDRLSLAIIPEAKIVFI